MGRKLGTLVIPEQMLAAILGVPEGMVIMGVHADWERMAVKIMVEGDILEEVEPGAEPPILTGTFVRCEAVDLPLGEQIDEKYGTFSKWYWSPSESQ